MQQALALPMTFSGVCPSLLGLVQDCDLRLVATILTRSRAQYSHMPLSQNLFSYLAYGILAGQTISHGISLATQSRNG